MPAPTPAPPIPDPDFPTLQTACRQLGIELTESQYDLLARYTQLVRDWNQRINLVSRRDTGRILSYHVIDSLAVQRLIPPDARVCDIGTGAGFPGIPVVLVRPNVKMFLIESSQKKSRFLQTAVAELGLGSVEVLNERAEMLTGLDCDVILSRLSGPLRDVVEYARPHRRPKGTIVLYKTRGSAEELRKAGRVLARHKLRITGSHDIFLPLSSVPRRFVVLGS